MTKISVIIPTYNRKSLLKNCLSTLFSQTYPKENFEIITVDDGSTDNTKYLIKTLKQQSGNLFYLQQSHSGVVHARNLGIKDSRGEIIAFTDDDCLPRKNWLEEIEKAFNKHPQALGIEGKTLTYSTKVTPLTSQIVNTHGGAYQTCNIAYKKKVLEQIGGFDKNFKYPHGDDVDLALRVLNLGQICFEPKVVVVHPPRPTTFKGELARVGRIPAEFYLFLKHPNYFEKKYAKTNIFFQVVFKNSIWIRLFHLKFYSNWIRKNPLVYLKFFLRTVLEIALIIILAPKFWLSFKRIKRELGTV